MAVNYNITEGKLHLNIEIDADSTNVDLDIAVALGAILASGYGQLLFGAINWAAISMFPWKRTGGPELAEKYGYCTLRDASHQAYCNLMTVVDKVAKYPRKDAQSAEQPSEALRYTNYVFGKVVDKLSEFCNSGKTEVRIDEIEDIMEEVNELFKSFENPDPKILAQLQAGAQNQIDNVPAQNQADTAVGNDNLNNISEVAQ